MTCPFWMRAYFPSMILSLDFRGVQTLVPKGIPRPRKGSKSNSKTGYFFLDTAIPCMVHFLRFYWTLVFTWKQLERLIPTAHKISHFLIIFHFVNGHFRKLNWRYSPYIRPKFQGIPPQNMAQNMVLTCLHLRILSHSHWFLAKTRLRTTHSYGTWPFTVDFPVKNVIFHRYVKLPEGTQEFPQNHPMANRGSPGAIALCGSSKSSAARTEEGEIPQSPSIIYGSLWKWLTVCHGKIHHF